MPTPPPPPIPARCVHCGAVLPGLWDTTTLLWGRCAECATWQQRSPVLVGEHECRGHDGEMEDR